MLLKQEFWSLFFEDYRINGLDIPRRFHTKEDKIQQKIITIQGLDIWDIAYTRSLVSLS